MKFQNLRAVVLAQVQTCRSIKSYDHALQIHNLRASYDPLIECTYASAVTCEDSANFSSYRKVQIDQNSDCAKSVLVQRSTEKTRSVSMNMVVAPNEGQSYVRSIYSTAKELQKMVVYNNESLFACTKEWVYISIFYGTNGP